MLEHTDTEVSPWYLVESDNKKKARINCISHLLGLIDYSDVDHEEISLPDRAVTDKVERPDKSNFNYVPEVLQLMNFFKNLLNKIRLIIQQNNTNSSLDTKVAKEMAKKIAEDAKMHRRSHEPIN